MDAALAYLSLAASAVVCLILALSLLRAHRNLTAARADSAALRSMLKKQAARPNTFSHEVRTPLTLIQGAAELLAEQTPGPLNAQQREFVATITDNAARAIELAQTMLAEARIDAQLFELRLESVDLRQLVRQTVRDARNMHGGRALRFDDAGAPVTLRGDASLLRQALLNLINNACRHAKVGTAVLVAVSRGEGQAIIAVSDEGTGMSEDERAQAFVPFSTSAGEQGVGLGLQITERIITEHGGQVLVDTIEGRGTTFFISLPLHRSPQQVGHDG